MANNIGMRSVFNYFAALLFFGAFHGVTLGQRVTFDILNTLYDYVILSGENIELRCCVTNINRAMIEIEKPDGDLLSNNGQSNCSSFRIPMVQEAHMGEYRCSLDYTCADSVSVVKELGLYINPPIINDGFPQCVRNGTYGKPYDPGEWVLMSCFCRHEDNCMWIAGVPGSGNAAPQDPNNEFDLGGTRVLQIMVTNELALDTFRFDCFYNVGGNGVSKKCSIGTRDDSSNDNVVSKSVMEPDGCTTTTTLSSSQDEARDRPDTTIPTTATKGELEPTNDDQTEQFEGLTIVIIAVSVFVCLLILVVIVIVCVTLRRRRGNNDSVDDTDDNAAYKNYIFSTGDDESTSPYYNSPGTAAHASDGAMNNASAGVSEHTYDTTPMRKLDPVPDDSVVETPSVGPAADEYAEIGASRSPSSKREVESRYSQEEEGHVESYSPVYREPEPIDTTDDHEGDFGLLYATVNKKKKGAP